MPEETKFVQRNSAAGRKWDNPILPVANVKGVKKEQPISTDKNQYYVGKEGAGSPVSKEEYSKAKGPKHYYTPASDKYKNK